jgi:hypothetical protein
MMLAAAALLTVMGAGSAWAAGEDAPAASTAPPPAAAAPAPIPIDTVCPRSMLAPKPNIPDPATVKNSGIAKANGEYKLWNDKVNAFVQCKNKELDAIEGQFKAQEDQSPVLAKKAEYDRVLATWEKGIADYKASGYPLPGFTKDNSKPGNCPASPGVANAPIPTLAFADAKKKDVKAAQATFLEWGQPRQAYLRCTAEEINSKIPELNAQTAPLRAKHDAIIADYNEVKAMDTTVRKAWDDFGKAYKARIRGAAGN